MCEERVNPSPSNPPLSGPFGGATLARNIPAVNHYEVLGVPMGADPAEIRRAYLHLARRHHPDRNVDADADTQVRARRKMADLNEAWAVLGDPVRRRHYDDDVRRGTATSGPTTVVGATGAASGQGWHPRADDTAWMQDFRAWRNETDELPPDEPYGGRSASRHNPLMILPVVVFVIAVAAGCVGLALQSRALLAMAFVGIAVSGAMFVMLPIIFMSRGRNDE